MTDKSVPFSVLDLAPIPQGSSAKEAFTHSLDLARLAESRGYHRYWLAEHHNMVGIASAATSVLIGYLAANTTTLHLGSGGVMLPNHSPLVIAEQFGTEHPLPRADRPRPWPRAGQRSADHARPASPYERRCR